MICSSHKTAMLIFASVLLTVNITVTLQDDSSLSGVPHPNYASRVHSEKFDDPILSRGGPMFTNSSCDFERSWCQWVDVGQTKLYWERTNAQTFNRTMARSGNYLFLQMNPTESKALDTAVLRSRTQRPLSLEQSSSESAICQLTLRFYYHWLGLSVKSIYADLVEINPEQTRHRVFEISNNYGDLWYRAIWPLPRVQNEFYIELVATRGASSTGTIALDDISLTLHCAELRRPNTVCEDAFAISAVHNKFNIRNKMENVTRFCTRPVPPTATEIRAYLTSEKGERENSLWLNFHRECDDFVRPTYEQLRDNPSLAGIGLPGDPLSSSQKEAALQALDEALEICDLRKTENVIPLDLKAEVYRLFLRSFAAMIPTYND